MRLDELTNKGELSITQREHPQGVKVRGMRGVIGPGEWLTHKETGRMAILQKVSKNGRIQMDLDEKLAWFNIEDWFWDFD